ncbi:hypothetical protein ERJ75_001010500 [Trypanosoma vivax]|nr:hypothetical protein TRVL_02976 [Trypanosoma vivax]KAH8611225.1 hypothetical protein ERJ75_001010500 [Trypanosoma vivax]
MALSGSFSNLFPAVGANSSLNLFDDTVTPVHSVHCSDSGAVFEHDLQRPPSFCNTPCNAFHNGLGGLDNWQLSSSNIAPTEGSAGAGLSRANSMISSMQKYSHDPYSLHRTQGTHSVRAQSFCNSATPNDCFVPNTLPPESYFTRNGPTNFVTSVVPREMSERRGRHRGRGRDPLRHGKPLADTPPPSKMRYFPPPPPSLRDTVHNALPFQKFEQLARRWYERVLACEQSYAWRIRQFFYAVHGGFHGFPPVSQTPFSSVEAASLCPRMNLSPQYTFNQWLVEAENWWNTYIQPLTVEYRQPPAYGLN